MSKLYDDIETEYRPDVRWWLAEGLNTDETLKANVKEIADSGFGAAEFLAMPEPGAPDNVYGWGSEEWTSDSQLVMKEATDRGLGFSLTSGAHWASANLPTTFDWDGQKYDIDNKAASKELDYATINLAGGDRFNNVLPKSPTRSQSSSAKEYVFEGVVAGRVTKARPGSGQSNGYAEGTGTGQVDLDSLIDLSDKVVKDGDTYSLDWTAPTDGQYSVFVYWMHGTGQTAEPSVSTNYAINYIDNYGVAALEDYWEQNVLTPELKELIRKSGRGEIYMDSLELTTYGAAGNLWGYHFKDEFKKRRGYDVTPYLPILSWDSTRIRAGDPKVYDYTAASSTDSAKIEKIRNDLYQTQSEMYEQNVLKPLQEWLHGLGMKLRAEPSYGTAFEISTPAKYIDGIETESFAQNADIDLYRGMLGSANMYNRPFSSETGAARNRNYIYNMDYYTQLSYLQFAGGVNRTVFHGYSGIEGSEADTYWPGHEGMYARYSERFNSRQPAAGQYKAWTEMLGRNQKVLRQGQAQRDLAILRTDNFFIDYEWPQENYPAERGYAMNDKPYFWQDLGLQHAGYTYDYFSPQLLEDEDNVEWNKSTLQPNGPSYKAVLLYQQSLELDSAKKLLKIARDGLPVVFVNNGSEIRYHRGPMLEYGKAASSTRSLGESDDDLAAVVNEIKALPNVSEVDDEADAMAALKEHGVEPRVEYKKPNNKLMTISRLDKKRNVLYTFVHSFKFEKDKADGPTTFDISTEGQGKPYTIDDWSGDVQPIGTYTAADGRTSTQLTLKPGEARIIATDLGDPGTEAHAVSTSADEVRLDGTKVSIVASKAGDYFTKLSSGDVITTNVDVPDPIKLDRWDLSLDDWNEGDKVTNTEEKFGHVTKEVYLTTKKTNLKFSDVPTVPWKDLPATQRQLSQLAGEAPKMGDVSGIGTYTRTFELPDDWDRSTQGAYFSVGSTGGGSTTVWVNDKKAAGLDLRTLKVDISDLLKRGTNTIKVTVASTLTNRMIQRDYDSYGSNWNLNAPSVQDHGLIGDVRVVPFTVAEVADTSAPSDSAVSGSAKTVRFGERATVDVKVTSSKVANGFVSLQTAAGSELATARVNQGTARLVLPAKSLRPATHQLKLVYEGSAATRPSSATVQLKVLPAKVKSSVSFKLSSGSIKAGQRGRATVVVKVKGVSAPTGTLQIKKGSKTVKTVTLRAKDKGRRTFTLPKLAKGKHTLKVVYSGDKKAKGKTSVKRTLRVS